MNKSQRIGFRLSKEEYDVLHYLSEALGLTMSEILRQGVRIYAKATVKQDTNIKRE